MKMVIYKNNKDFLGEVSIRMGTIITKTTENQLYDIWPQAARMINGLDVGDELVIEMSIAGINHVPHCIASQESPQ